MAVFAILLAKLLSLVTIFLGVLVGFLSRAWWHVAVGSVIVAIIQEWALSAAQVTRRFDPMIFLIGVAAAAVWASVAFALKMARQKKKHRQISN